MPRRALGFVACALALLLGLPAAAAAAPSGGVEPYGGAPDLGAGAQSADAYRIIGVVGTPTGGGYWQFSVDGAVYAHGDAPFLGDMAGRRLNLPVVGMAASPTGLGYWLVASDGGIFPFGDARFLGSTGAMRLNRPIVGMAATPTGQGYWLVASDGGIFSFGDARFQGSTGAMRLNRPIVGMAASPTGLGYWLVASDGGIFTFGDATFLGSGGGQALPEPVVGVAATPTGRGYRMATVDGRILAFGDATDAGGSVERCRSQGVVGLAGRTTGGYWLATAAVLPAPIPPGTDPIDTVTAESANMTRVLRLYDACRPTPAPRAGRFASPLPGSRLSSGYGSRIHPIYKKPQFHSGIDLAGAGTKILAAADGVVVQVLRRQGFGLTTIVDHGDGTATVYGHQSAVAVHEGQAVRQGQVIGTVGHTGYATGDHLHFEVRVHGVPTDPRSWL